MLFIEKTLVHAAIITMFPESFWTSKQTYGAFRYPSVFKNFFECHIFFKSELTRISMQHSTKYAVNNKIAASCCLNSKYSKGVLCRFPTMAFTEGVNNPDYCSFLYFFLVMLLMQSVYNGRKKLLIKVDAIANSKCPSTASKCLELQLPNVLQC